MLDLSLLTTAPLYSLFIGFCAVMAVAVSKAGFGGSLGALSTPIMVLAFSPVHALGILLPIFIVIDIWVVWHWRKLGVRRIIFWMVFFGLAGQLAGWALLRFGAFDDSILLLFIGLMGIATGAKYFIEIFLMRPTSHHIRQRIKSVRSRVIGRASIWCSFAGFTSFVSLTGGIPVQVYLLPFRLPRQIFVGTMAWFFLSINAAKLPFFIDLNFITGATLFMTALLLIFVPVGVMTGRWLNQKMSDKVFYVIAHILLLLLGMQLLWRYLSAS